MDQYLVTAVATQYDCRFGVQITEPICDPARDRGFPCASDGEVANADNRDGRFDRPENPVIVELPSKRYRSTIKPFERTKGSASKTISSTLALPDFLYEAHAASSASLINRSNRDVCAAASRVVAASTSVGGP